MKTQSISLSKYIEFKNPTYVYIHVIPHKGIRNYSSKNMAKTIAYTYKEINNRVKKEQKKLFFETNFKISYLVDIRKTGTSFYFLVPEALVSDITTQITDTWDKATIEILDAGIEPFSKDAEIYEVSYKKADALSLEVDSRSSEPLSSILNVIEIMKDDDRVSICYNFMPSSQSGWIDNYEDTMKRYKDNKSLAKPDFTVSSVFRMFLGVSLGFIDTIFETVSEVLVGEKSTPNLSFYDLIMGSLADKREVSILTKKKKEQTILQTQIAVVSNSVSDKRKKDNALAVCQSYNVLDGDNELKYKKINHTSLDINKHNLGLKSSTFSVDEVSNFIQVPGKSLLDKFGIEHIKINETIIPEKLTSGTKLLGDVTYKGETIKAYLENDYNNGNLPLCAIGSQGGGKSTFLKNYARDCNKAGESVFVIDFIKDCELSDSIKEAIPPGDLIELDLSSQETMQGFGFNEIILTDDISDFDKLKLANLQAMQILSLVDSMNPDSPLTARMRRFLSAAANVVFVQKCNSLKNVIDCLENYEKRTNYIQNLNAAQKHHLEDEINALYELDEYSRGTKDSPPEIVGTCSSKIDHILDRVALLREDFKLKFMYNLNLSNNIDFVDCMDKGKSVLLRMKESEFPTKVHKNILVTYFISKLWLASQLRGAKHRQPSRCNVIVDEVFQAPTCMKNLEYILPQSRKFGLKFFFTLQYAFQLKSIFDALEASGASFLLLTGCNQDDFNRFKDKLPNFQFEDLRDMPKFHAMCLIKYSDGYSSFIVKLPPPPRQADY